MTITAPLGLAAWRDRLVALTLVASAPLILLNTHSAAVANKFAEKIGVTGVTSSDGLAVGSLLKTVLAPADNAGSSEIMALFKAVVALTLLGGIAFFILGILKTMGGRRGGGEAVLQVIFGLIVAVAGLEVLA